MSEQTADVPLILTEAGRQLAQRARDAETKLAAVRQVIETQRFEVAVQDFEVTDSAVLVDDVLRVLGEQPAGVLLTREEAHTARLDRAAISTLAKVMRNDRRTLVEKSRVRHLLGIDA